MPEFTKWVKTESQQGLTVPQVAERYGCREPLVWSIALEGKDDLQRFKELNWELLTVDPWEWTDFVPHIDAIAGNEDVLHEIIGLIWYRLSGRI